MIRFLVGSLVGVGVAGVAEGATGGSNALPVATSLALTNSFPATSLSESEVSNS